MKANFYSNFSNWCNIFVINKNILRTNFKFISRDLIVLRILFTFLALI